MEIEDIETVDSDASLEVLVDGLEEFIAKKKAKRKELQNELEVKRFRHQKLKSIENRLEGTED